MEISEVSVTKGLTLSMGKFESIRLDASISVRPEKGEDEDVLFNAAYEICESQLEIQVQMISDSLSENSGAHMLYNKEEKPAKKKSRRRTG